MLDTENVSRSIYTTHKKVKRIITNKMHSIIYGNKTHWFQVGYKDSTDIWMNEYEETTLYSGGILTSMNTLKYSYKSAQYSIRAIGLNNLQTSQYMPERWST